MNKQQAIETCAPIALFLYNRPEHAKQTIASLRNNDLANESDLWVFCDGAKAGKADQNLDAVRELAQAITGFRTVNIVQRQENLGLAKSIISGVSQVLQNSDRVIVMEDDLLTRKDFLKFMNRCLQLFKDDAKVQSITGFSHPIPFLQTYPHDVFLTPRASSWGWGTWGDRWSRVDWELSGIQKFFASRAELKLFARGGEDLIGMLKAQVEGKINSWAIRWSYAHYLNKTYCLYPRTTLVRNIGFDGTGTHCGPDDPYTETPPFGINPVNPQYPVNVDHDLIEEFSRYFKRPLKQRLKKKLKSFLQASSRLF